MCHSVGNLENVLLRSRQKQPKNRLEGFCSLPVGKNPHRYLGMRLKRSLGEQSELKRQQSRAGIPGTLLTLESL